MTQQQPIPPLPDGFGVELDAGTKELDAGVWFGGSPARVLCLTRAGRKAWASLRSTPVSSRTTGQLGRRLTDAGLAHPIPPAPRRWADLTVVIPVRDRSDELDRCLATLGGRHPVIVVDDASADPESVAAIADRHGAKIISRSANGGPGAARDTGLEQVDTELVAFIDSDCTPPRGGWLNALAAHFDDPAVAAVAPRVTAEADQTWAGRYTAAQGSLDLGPEPARVAPGARVGYVPTAVLLTRCAALRAVATNGAAFDPALRVGEDVDLIWRLHAAGWRIRYDPSVEVPHREPATWSGLLARRFRYGTSAAALAKRHGTAVAPLAVHPWPSAVVAAALAGQPVLAATAFAGSVASTTRALRAAEVPTRGVVPAMAGAARQTWLGIGRYLVQLAGPLLVVGLLRRRSRRASAALVLGPPLTAWAGNRAGLDPVRFTAGWLADQVSYGAGVWTGCVQHRTTVPLRPVVARRPVRIDSPPVQTGV